MKIDDLLVLLLESSGDLLRMLFIIVEVVTFSHLISECVPEFQEFLSVFHIRFQ